MSMVEGIGDEVLQFFGVVVVVGVALIAWWSTNISEGPLIRTVLILERRSRSRTTNDSTPQPLVTSSSNENTIDTGQVNPTSLPELSENSAGTGTGNSSNDKDENESGSSLLLAGSTPSVTIQPVGGDSSDLNQEAPVIEPVSTTQSDPLPEAQPQGELSTETDSLAVPSSDADSVRRRRLAFFQSRGPTLIESPEAVLNEISGTPTANENYDDDDDDSSTLYPDIIRIRLKYLNDDETIVLGRLQEQLGDFKRRHFRIELAAEKMVRLIFNGQVLQSDSQTLQGYGLFNNCVVHCLVHNQRNSAPRLAQTQSDVGSSQSTPPDWNLGTLLYTCLSVILGFAWYCRYQYSHLFTVTTTAALCGLTSMFAVTLLSIYLPDQDNIQ